MQAAYTGFEAVVSRILRIRGVQFEKSGKHHADLLGAVVDQGLFTDEKTIATLYDLMGFRHFIRNAYGVDLREQEIAQKAQILCAAWDSISGALLNEIQAPQKAGLASTEELPMPENSPQKPAGDKEPPFTIG